MTSETDVLVVGAGPTGLVLALWLTRLGAHVRIVDRLAEPATTTRALAVQARTLELYRQIGIADACTQHMLRLHVFSWRPEFSRAGVLRDAVYLVRPDGYVALASRQGGAAAIASYLVARTLAPGKRA